MASSQNLASLDAWTFRPSFADTWISDAFARDPETLTKALQNSLSGGNSDYLLSDTVSPFLDLVKPESAPTPAVSGSGSDQEPAPRRQRSAIPAAGGRVAKRKSRASKRSQTTFITADPANFRQMVQQVTGVRFGGAAMQAAPVLKPEPQRIGSRYSSGGGVGGCLLPTLDTSAFLLQQQMVGPSSGGGVVGTVYFPAPAMVGDGGAAAGLDFDTFSSFPTLESWKAM